MRAPPRRATLPAASPRASRISRPQPVRESRATSTVAGAVSSRATFTPHALRAASFSTQWAI